MILSDCPLHCEECDTDEVCTRCVQGYVTVDGVCAGIH